MNVSRRSVLRGIGVAGASLAFAGYATAADGDVAQFVVSGNANVGSRLEDAGYEVRRELADGQVYVVHGPADGGLEDVAGVESAAQDVRLELVEPFDRTPTVEEVEPPAGYEGFLWDKQNIESLAANERATGEGASVAIIDTGIDYAHPELVPNLDEDAGRLFRMGEIQSGVGEVFVPDDYFEPTELTTAEFHVADEQHGHGTHVGGIAAAAGGGQVIGTAPDADLVALRVFWWTLAEDDGELVPVNVTTTGDILAAIDHAAAQGYDVANLSLGTAPIHPGELDGGELRDLKVPYHQVIQHAVQQDTVVTASAGNSETDLGGGLFSLPNSVAGATSVSATGPNDELSFYSDYGTSEVDVGAPGGGYETLEKTNIEDPDVVDWPFPLNLVFSTTSARVEGGAYGWKAGTSMAAPQVAGLVALVRELDPDANPNQVESAIKHGAEGANGRSDEHLGAGRINARNTVERLD